MSDKTEKIAVELLNFLFVRDEHISFLFSLCGVIQKSTLSHSLLSLQVLYLSTVHQNSIQHFFFHGSR